MNMSKGVQSYENCSNQQETLMLVMAWLLLLLLNKDGQVVVVVRRETSFMQGQGEDDCQGLGKRVMTGWERGGGGGEM